MQGVSFRAASDQALLVEFGDRISVAVSDRVTRLVRLLTEQPIAGLEDMNPAYCSLLVKFDGRRFDHAAIEMALKDRIAQLESAVAAPARTIEIPVCYGGEFGPDLEEVAAMHGLTSSRAIAMHSEVEYRVCFLGFVPGFAYLVGLPDDLATPRLPSPRKRVPPGSVAIGGNQAGVYPFPTPGGWRLLGRTPLTMFRADRDPASVLALGDGVRFVPTSAEQFAELECECR
ncbi:MAG: 5-oxoprolinase subunit PxpB [Bryobacteraceae bacterium]